MNFEIAAFPIIIKDLLCIDLPQLTMGFCQISPP